MSPPAPAALVLASGSAARLRVLRDAGIDPEVVVSGVDESTDGELSTAAVVELLGERKAAAYIASGEPMAMAGAFSIEGPGAPFVNGIEGDPGTVLGVSLPLLRRLLAEAGVANTGLWRTPLGVSPGG